MARIDNLNHFLADVADAIRNKKGTSGQILAKNFDSEIASISGGGEVLPVTITYTFDNQIAGNAKGTITLSTTDSSANGNYKLYWANENGIMENHSAINTMTLSLVANTPLVYDKFCDVNFIPKYATKVVACKEGTYEISGAFDIPSNKLFGGYGEHNYSFGVLADIHIPSTPNENPLSYATFETAGTDFASALLWFNNRENVEHTDISGDITCTSTQNQCEMYKAIRDICSNSKEVRFALGNHDVAYSQYLSNHTSDFNNGDGKNFSKTVGDDVFVYLSVESNSKSSDLFSTESLIWLEDLLEENRNKRVFVFTHVPPHYRRCDGFSNPNGIYSYDIWGNTDIKQDRLYVESMLSRYKNSIWFFGHTHIAYYLQERNVNCNYYRWNENGARMFHTSSCSVPRDDSLNGQRTELEGKSEGYVVDVYDNTILVRGREFADNFYIGLAQYIVDTTIENIAPRTTPIVPREGEKTLSSISATKTKTNYEVGETFSTNDVVVIAHYSDLTENDVTSSSIIGTVDTSTSGNKTLEISYTEDDITVDTTIGIFVGTESDTIDVGGYTLNLVNLPTSFSASEVHSGVKMDSSTYEISITNNYALSDAFRVSKGDTINVEIQDKGAWTARFVTIDSDGNVLAYSPSGSTEISATTTQKSYTISSDNAYAVLLRMYGSNFNTTGSLYKDEISISIMWD